MTENDEKILKVDALGRVRVSKEDREAILDEFERSGMPGTRFAARHGIKYPTFANWVQKRKRARGGYPEPESGTPDGGRAKAGFALVEMRPEPVDDRNAADTAGDGLSISLPGGVCLTVRDARQAELAAAVLAALKTTPDPGAPC